MTGVGITVYIPSWANFDGASAQVSSLNQQRRNLMDEGILRSCRVIVSDNDGSYCSEELISAGATEVIRRPCNLGGDVNIALGFLSGGPGELLWILSDNDLVADSALSTICEAFRRFPDADILIGSRVSTATEQVTLSAPPDAAGGDWAAGLISGVVYRYSSIASSVPYAFQFTWTGWSQLAVQRWAFFKGELRTAALVPLSSIVAQTRGDRSQASIDRARENYRHSFFGGLLFDYAFSQETSGSGKHAVSRWWRRYWYLASAYRQPRSRELGTGSGRDFRQGLASSVVRTGSVGDRALWLLSLPPYWRVARTLRRSQGQDR